jgi:hypothetical protein
MKIVKIRFQVNLPLKHIPLFKKASTWYMPVILATWKAKIGRITVQIHARQKIQKTPSEPIVGDVYLAAG